MRFAGAAEVTRGFGPHDHLCWSYEDAGQLRLRAAEFLADGLRQDQQVCYVAAGPADDLLTELAELADAEQAVRRGAIRLMNLDEMYGASHVVNAHEQVAAYAAATSSALVNGYTGLRVAADATPLVGTPEQLEAFTRYEHLVDRYMVDQPFSAMCAYDRTALGDDTIAQLACMHPASTPGVAPFRLHAVTSHHFALGGELDLTAKDLLPLALRRAHTQPGRIMIDASELTFVDHRSLLVLDEFAREHDTYAVLVGAPGSAPARLTRMLGLTAVHVELAA